MFYIIMETEMMELFPYNMSVSLEHYMWLSFHKPCEASWAMFQKRHTLTCSAIGMIQKGTLFFCERCQWHFPGVIQPKTMISFCEDLRESCPFWNATLLDTPPTD